MQLMRQGHRELLGLVRRVDNWLTRREIVEACVWDAEEAFPLFWAGLLVFGLLLFRGIFLGLDWIGTGYDRGVINTN